MSEKKELIYDGILKECKELKISISELCRLSGVNRPLLNRWKNEDPKSIIILNKLNTSLQLEKQKQLINK
jgi:transcriptional regulator with XRE-family HTH domain